MTTAADIPIVDKLYNYSMCTANYNGFIVDDEVTVRALSLLQRCVYVWM